MKCTFKPCQTELSLDTCGYEWYETGHRVDMSGLKDQVILQKFNFRQRCPMVDVNLEDEKTDNDKLALKGVECNNKSNNASAICQRKC